MSDIPKIVRNRLQTVQVSGDHPEPNLLAAFGENTLRRDERERLLKHLAACTDCRDILALATPELSAAIASVPARTGWLRWPALRWAAAGACVVVVGAAVSLRYGPHPAQTPPSDLGAVAPSSTPAVVAELQTPRAQAVVPQQKPAELDLQKKLADKVEAPSPAKRALIAGELAKKSNEHAASGFALGGAATPANQPAAPASGLRQFSEPVAGNQEARESADLKEQKPAPTDAAKESLDVVAPAETATSSRDELAAPISGKAKDADEAKLRMKQDASGSLAYAVRAPAKAEGLYRTDTEVVPRWKVSPDGVLQRSSDSGQTWQPVPVATKITFRAVASLGADVWAGGSPASLYHSTDSGRSWTRITPADHGTSLATDIVAITFSSFQHLDLTTATHEIWTTTDGGQTWQKR